MNKQLVLIPGLFALGMLVGITIMNSRSPDEPVDNAAEMQMSPEPESAPSANPFASSQTRTSNDRLQAMQAQIDRLSERIVELERHTSAAADEAESDDEMASQTANTGASQSAPKYVLTAERLVKAGINQERADDIVRRKNDIELKKLELRDRATREGYLGTGRYNRELNELTAAEISLRDELGDDDYDRYLFASGQNNRVLVTSVMIGSQAEFAGIQDGDIILSYDDRILFEWSELQQATTQGERGEYVNVNVWRDGQLTNLWIPRGPLGVRLGATRREP